MINASMVVGKGTPSLWVIKLINSFDGIVSWLKFAIATYVAGVRIVINKQASLRIFKKFTLFEYK